MIKDRINLILTPTTIWDLFMGSTIVINAYEEGYFYHTVSASSKFVQANGTISLSNLEITILKSKRLIAQIVKYILPKEVTERTQGLTLSI